MVYWWTFWCIKVYACVKPNQTEGKKNFVLCVCVCVCVLQRDGVCAVENGSVVTGGDEYEWTEQRRMHMVSILRGFRGLVCSTVKENQDSDADLDVDGDDSLNYGKAQYSETDVIPSSRDAEESETGLNADAASRLQSPEHAKWLTAETPSTSNEEHSKADGSASTSPPTCRSCELQLMSSDSLNTLEALKMRIRDLEKQLTRGDRIKCLICMVILPFFKLH
uniref:E3 ubiquitin-protein ligase RNF220 middle domain-containing protein n=1 Tax=Astyanax mexicanus TaxID=7994 RepID=A0A8B9JDK2_ASTMX